MAHDMRSGLRVKPSAARSAVRAARRVEVPLQLEGGQIVLVKVSKAQALAALGRARERVELVDPFEDGCLILGG